MIKPKGQVIRSNLSEKAYTLTVEPVIEIKEWCPDNEAKLPPEQVHFVVRWPVPLEGLPAIVIRFKGPDTLGFFIEELIRFRRSVWPTSEKVTGEK